MLVFAGMLVGTYVGTFAPWADHARIGPNHLWWYLQPFLSINVIQIFVLGSLFFTVAALTRRILVVYLQGVALFVVYLIGQTAYFSARSLEHFWSGIFDPVGWIVIDNVARYWSVLEKNTLLMPWDFSGNSPGVFLYNRLLWASVGVLSLATTWALFPMSVEALARRSQSKRAASARTADAEDLETSRPALSPTPSPVRQVFGAATTFGPYVTLSRLRTRAILREVPFWGIAVLMIVFGVNNGHFAGRSGGQDVWPVTYLMLQAVEGGATLFFYIVATLYAGELIWRERDTHFDGIHDALPMRESIDWLSKFTAIAVVEFLLLALTMLTGIAMQALAGYYHFELLQYVKELYVVTFPQILAFALLAMFVQTMVSNKFVGHADRDRAHRAAADPVQLRVGEHALSPRLDAAIHLLRHERVRAFRAGAVLGDRLLDLDLRGARGRLDRILPPRRGGFARGPNALGAPQRDASRSGGRAPHDLRGRIRRLVLLQRARGERILSARSTSATFRPPTNVTSRSTNTWRSRR